MPRRAWVSSSTIWGCGREFKTLPGGAEAEIVLHDESGGVVYKFFDLRFDHEQPYIGKKMVAVFGESGWEVEQQNADLFETIEKLAVLHEVGALPTEIVAIADTQEHLLVKQPFAHTIEVTGEARAKASSAVNSVLVASSSGLRGQLRVFWHEGKAWFLDDLHHKNIMEDADGNPSIIDALIGVVPDRMIEHIPELKQAIYDARIKVGDLSDKQSELNIFDDGEDILDDLP